jgi:hypothetical protein
MEPERCEEQPAERGADRLKPARKPADLLPSFVNEGLEGVRDSHC